MSGVKLVYVVVDAAVQVGVSQFTIFVGDFFSTMIQCLLKNIPNEVKSHRFILMVTADWGYHDKKFIEKSFSHVAQKRGNGDLFRFVYFAILHLLCVSNVFAGNVNRRVAKPDDQQTVTLTETVWQSGWELPHR